MTTIFRSSCECGAAFTNHSGTSSTLVGFGDGDCGLPHDDNCEKRQYVCANGHWTQMSIRRRCPCGWEGKEECWCHDPKEKVDQWPEGVPGSKTFEERQALYKQHP